MFLESAEAMDLLVKHDWDYFVSTRIDANTSTVKKPVGFTEKWVYVIVMPKIDIPRDGLNMDRLVIVEQQALELAKSLQLLL